MNSDIHVLQVMAGDRHGGAETFFVNMVLALAEAGVRQTVVTRQHPARLERLKTAGVPTETVSFAHWAAPYTRWKLRRLIRERRPDIVQTWMGRASAMTPKEDAVKIGRFGGYYDLKRFRDCDWFLGITEDIAAHLRKSGAPPERVRVIPNFPTLADEPPADRAELQTPEDAPVLLALARLHWKKGLDTLLHAVEGLPGAYLWIAGEGPDRQELEALCRRLGLRERVRFLGWREDRVALLRAADICAFPSRYEPFGTVILEAWATETPLVAAASQGPSAYVTPEQDGLLVEIDDVEGLRTALKRVIEDPELRRRLAVAGRERYLTSFSKDIAVKRYLDFYREVLNGA